MTNLTEENIGGIYRSVESDHFNFAFITWKGQTDLDRHSEWCSSQALRLSGSLYTSARWLAVAQVDFRGDNLFPLVLKRDSSSKVNHSSAALFSSSPGSPPGSHFSSPAASSYLYQHSFFSSRLLRSSCFVPFIFLPLLPTVSKGPADFHLIIVGKLYGKAHCASLRPRLPIRVCQVTFKCLRYPLIITVTEVLNVRVLPHLNCRRVL